jgi:hypothetical protein
LGFSVVQQLCRNSAGSRLVIMIPWAVPKMDPDKCPLSSGSLLG